MLMLPLTIFAIVGVTGTFLNTLYTILVFRALLGIGITGMSICATALLADNYSGAELKKKTNLQSSSMRIRSCGA